MKISFDCLKCLKHLQLEEHIYKKAYEGHELCLSCRPVEDETPMSNTIDKQKLVEFINNSATLLIPSESSFCDGQINMLYTIRDHILSGAFDIPNNHLRFPRQANKEAGWTISYDYIGKIDEHIQNTGTDETASYEAIENVLLSVEALSTSVTEPTDTCIGCGKPFEHDLYNVHCNDCGTKAEQDGAGMEYVEQVLESELSVDRCENCEMLEDMVSSFQDQLMEGGNEG